MTTMLPTRALLSRQTWAGWPAATAVGLLLRVLLLGSKSLWLDEAMSLYVAGRGPQAWLAGLDVLHPPLYVAFLSLWARPGQSEALLRLPSALFGVLAIPVAYLLGRSLAGMGVGRATAWLVALSPLLVWYSQESRSYSLLVLLALVSSLAFVRLVLRPRPGWWLLYVTATAAALYTHYDAVLIAPVQFVLFLALLAQARVARVGALAALAAWPAIGAAFWPWLASPAGKGFADFVRATGGYPAELLGQVLGLGWSAAVTLAAGMAAAAVVAGLVGGWVVRHWGLWPRVYRSPWLRALVATLFVLLLVASVLPRGYSIKRHAVIAAPYICLAVAWFWPLSGRLSRAFGVLLALSVAAALVNVVAIPKDDWRSTVQHLRTVYQPGDAVWITPGYDHVPFEYYDRGRLPVAEIDDVAAGGEAARSLGRIWLVYSDTPTQVVDNGPQLEAALGATHRLALEWSAYRVRVLLFEPR